MSDIVETMREYKEYAETKSEREAFDAVIGEITRLRADLASVTSERDKYKEIAISDDKEIQKLQLANIDNLAEITRLCSDLAAITEERDALAARLEPVDDEELVEIAAYYFTDGSSWSNLSERLRNNCRRDAREIIAEIRPHIEAAEREKWQKVLARMGAGTTKTGAVNE